MTRTRPIAYLRLDARRKFYLAVGVVGGLGMAFAAGLVVGQQFPQPIPETFEAGFTNTPGTQADIDAPGQGDLFTFYASLEGEGTAPVVPDVRPALIDEVVEAAEGDPAVGGDEVDAPPEDDGVGEAVAAVDDGVRAVPREADDDAIGEAPARENPVLEREPVRVAAAAPSPEPESDRVGEAAVGATSIGATAAADDSARPLQRRVVREAPEAASVDASATEAPSAAAAPSGDGAQRYEVTVHEAASWDDADLARQHLREAGLRATVVTRGTGENDRSWAVVLRGEADDAEVRRQERLASRVLRAELPRR